jgi:hypothetical protein
MSSVPQMSSGLSKLKKKHFRVKHQKVKVFRANEPLLSVYMWGVNHTVSFKKQNYMEIILLKCFM